MFYFSFSMEEIIASLEELLEKLRPSDTVPQSAVFDVIKNSADWERVAMDVEVELERFGIVSFDTESYLPSRVSSADHKKNSYAIMGFPSGYVIVLDIRELERNSGKLQVDAFPSEFLNILNDVNIVKCGSKIDEDLRLIGVTPNNTCETSDVYKKAIFEGLYDNTFPNCSGLGIIAHKIFGLHHDYKTFDSARKYQNRYGELPPRYKIWPPWRTFTLYAWQRRHEIYAKGYMRNDGITPLALIVDITIKMAKSGRLWSRSLKDALLSSSKGVERCVFEDDDQDASVKSAAKRDERF